MRLKPKPRRPNVRVGYLKLNRSNKLEGKTGYYDGRLIKSNRLWLGPVEQRRA